MDHELEFSPTGIDSTQMPVKQHSIVLKRNGCGKHTDLIHILILPLLSLFTFL